MKRHQVYGGSLLAVIAVWIYFKITSNTSSTEQKWIIDVFPWYVLICFGCYCLSKLGYDLLTFNDYPLEIIALEKDIKMADADLKSRGFTH
jgi:dolichyl-phosphate mannosyltransferase polypeptide 3